MKLKHLKHTDTLDFFAVDEDAFSSIPMFSDAVQAGFPSPAEDHSEQKISLDKVLVKNKEATFYAKVSGQSMIGAGLDDGDLLIVDRSQNPEHNKIAVCFIDGEFTIKRLKVSTEGVFLIPENPKYDPIKVNEENHFQIWGIVTHVIKKV